MRILWIVNMLLPDIADHLGVGTSASGTWMIDISHMLSCRDDTQLAVACVYGKEFRKIEHDHITYYLLPGTGKSMLRYTRAYEKLWVQVNADFQPDLVHLHGTEYSHGLSFLRACPQVKAVVSLQGMLSKIKDVDFGEIPVREFIRNRTLRQNLHLNGEIELHFLHKFNARYEHEILQRAGFANGVNTWDTSLCKSINPNIRIYKLEYNLRKEMYASPKWDITKIRRHSIFTNPGNVPLKGLHQLLHAVALLKPRYPDVCIYVPGSGKDGKIVVTSAYTKYLKKLIDRLNLADNIRFMGRLTSEAMCEQMRTSHVAVVPSAIEGTSLVLREAMFLGCPSIASFRGGMADFINDREDGFLYDFSEYAYLAARLSELFANDDLAVSFSKKGMQKAQKAHDREQNLQAYMDMYQDIFNS